MADTLIPPDGPVIWVNRNRVSGAPCFYRTRVPVLTLFQYLESGDPLDEFLEDFPHVSEQQAKAVLRLAYAAATGRPAVAAE